MADKPSETGHQSNILIQNAARLNKHGILQLYIKASWQAQVAKDKLDVPLPHDDDAPNEQILCLTSHGYLWQALKTLQYFVHF